MAIIETKYNVGDTFYYGTTSYEKEYIECPDCLGHKKVHITFADQRLEEIDCYTCKNYGFPEVSIGKLSFKVWKTKIKVGKIISVDIRDSNVSYQVNFGYEQADNGELYDGTYILSEHEIFMDIDPALAAAEEQLERHTASELEHLTKKKGGFATRLEQSRLGFTRRRALEEERDAKRWLKAIKGK